MNTACNGDIDVRNLTTSGFTRKTNDVRASESVNLILNGTDRFQLYSSQAVTVYGSYEYAKPSRISHDLTFEFLNAFGLPMDQAWVEYNPELSGGGRRDSGQFRGGDMAMRSSNSDVEKYDSNDSENVHDFVKG